jgi:hypothetical protein
VQGAERLWDPQSLLFNGSRVFIAWGLRRPKREGTSGPQVLPNLKRYFSYSCTPSGPRGQLDILLVSVLLELLAVSKICLSRASEQLPASEGKVCSVCWTSELYTGCPTSTSITVALMVPIDVATFTCTKQLQNCSNCCAQC